MIASPVGDWIRRRYPPNSGATHYLGPDDDPGCCAGPHPACTYDAAFREGAAAERDRIRQLAFAHNAWCIPPYGCTDLKCQNCSARPLTGPFAELLDGAP